MSNLTTRSTRIPEFDDYAYIMSNDGLSDGKVELGGISRLPESSSFTVNLNSSMTASEIQDEINSVGKYLRRDTTVTFQFADGTYNLDATLSFTGFHGGGNIYIQGNTGETSDLHTNQAVHLNFNNDTNGIYCINNQVFLYIRFLKITADDGYMAIYLQRPGFSNVRYNYLINNGKTSTGSRSIYLAEGHSSDCVSNYFSNSYFGIFAAHSSRVISNNNDSTGTNPNYGLYANTNSVIGKFGVNQPSGSTADEADANGGVVRS